MRIEINAFEHHRLHPGGGHTAVLIHTKPLQGAGTGVAQVADPVAIGVQVGRQVRRGWAAVGVHPGTGGRVQAQIHAIRNVIGIVVQNHGPAVTERHRQAETNAAIEKPAAIVTHLTVEYVVAGNFRTQGQTARRQRRLYPHTGFDRRINSGFNADGFVHRANARVEIRFDFVFGKEMHTVQHQAGLPVTVAAAAANRIAEQIELNGRVRAGDLAAGPAESQAKSGGVLLFGYALVVAHGKGLNLKIPGPVIGRHLCLRQRRQGHQPASHH